MRLFAITCPYELSDQAFCTSLALQLGTPIPHALYLQEHERGYSHKDSWGDDLLNKPGHASYLRKGTHNEIARQVAQQATAGGVLIAIFLAQFFCPKIGPKFISEGSSDPSDDRYVPIYICTYIYYMYVHILCS